MVRELTFLDFGDRDVLEADPETTVAVGGFGSVKARDVRAGDLVEHTDRGRWMRLERAETLADPVEVLGSLEPDDASTREVVKNLFKWWNPPKRPIRKFTADMLKLWRKKPGKFAKAALDALEAMDGRFEAWKSSLAVIAECVPPPGLSSLLQVVPAHTMAMANAAWGGDAAAWGPLSDSLEEIGAPAVLLEHVRKEGNHMRGCWAIRLIKEAACGR